MLLTELETTGPSLDGRVGGEHLEVQIYMKQPRIHTFGYIHLLLSKEI